MTKFQLTPGMSKVQDVAHSHAELAPVFIYSGYRTSSTWLWSKFRKDPKACAYYEPFNEILAGLKADSILSIRPESWRSHHPADGGYMVEYGSMLTSEPGIPLFPSGDQDGERYIGSAGVEGPLDPDIQAYVSMLITAAQERGRVPVLACTRLLGRAAGLRSAFDGYHILLVRNLLQQWNSYSGQLRFGNDYFFRVLFNSLKNSKNNIFISYLSGYFSENEIVDFSVWIRPENHDRIFCYFVAFHVYFLMVTRRHADLVVDVNRLVRLGSAHQAEVSGLVASRTGLRIDLDDARESVDYPLQPLRAVGDCRMLLRTMVDRLLIGEAINNEDQSFVEGLIADLWDEHARFAACTTGAAEVIAHQTVRVEDEARRRSEAEVAQTEISTRLTELEQQSAAQIDAVKAAAETEIALARASAAEVSAKFDAATQEVLRLERALSEEAQVHATELTEARTAAAEMSAKFDAAAQEVLRLERALSEEAQVHATELTEARTAAAEAAIRLEAAAQQVKMIDRQRADEARTHADVLRTVFDRIVTAEADLANANSRLATLQQQYAGLAQENGRLEGELSARGEAHAARLADAFEVRRDLASRLSNAEAEVIALRAEVTALHIEMATQARSHNTALAVANGEVDQFTQQAANLSQQLAVTIQQRDGLTVELEGIRQNAAEQADALRKEISQLRGHIAWREGQLQQAANLLSAIPDLLAGLPRLLAALVRQSLGKTRLEAVADHQAAVAHWQSDTMLSSAPSLPVETDASLAVSQSTHCQELMDGHHPLREIVSPITSVIGLLELHDQPFILAAYQSVLGRAPDAEGEMYYLTRLRTGVHKLAILKQLRQSPEGRTFRHGVAGLDRAIMNHRWATLPILGALVRLLTGAEGDNATQCELRILTNEIGRMRVSLVDLRSAAQHCIR